MIASLSLAASAAQGAEPAEPVRIRVEAKELHKVDRRLFGQFLERPSWGETGPEIATDTNGVLSAEVVSMLRAMQIPIVRFPGGTDVDYVDWTDMISNVPRRASERPALWLRLHIAGGSPTSLTSPAPRARSDKTGWGRPPSPDRP